MSKTRLDRVEEKLDLLLKVVMKEVEDKVAYLETLPEIIEMKRMGTELEKLKQQRGY